MNSKGHTRGSKKVESFAGGNFKIGYHASYLYTCANCSSLCRYWSQGNPFHSILAPDLSMCEYVSCALLHT